MTRRGEIVWLFCGIIGQQWGLNVYSKGAVATAEAAVSKHHDFYPWGGKDLESRSEDLLRVMRLNRHLPVADESLLSSFVESTADGDGILHLRDAQSEPYIATIMPDEESSGDDDLYNAETLSKKFEGLCAIFPTDYWNYEWCHR